MPMLKIEIPQETFEQLLIVAARDWRPTVWQAEWLLRKAVQTEYDAGAPPAEPVGVGSDEQNAS